MKCNNSLSQKAPGGAPGIEIHWAAAYDVALVGDIRSKIQNKVEMTFAEVSKLCVSALIL